MCFVHGLSPPVSGLELAVCLFGVEGRGEAFWGRLPRRSGHQSRDARERDGHDGLRGTGGWEMDFDHRLHLDDLSGDLDEAQPERIELGSAPHRTFGERDAQPPH